MDHYKALGVDKTASKEEIKKAFRKLAMQFHPDKHSQSSKNSRDAATLKFKQLSEAYDTLIDDRKRADYNIKSRTNFYNNKNNGYKQSYGNYGYGYSGSGNRRSSETFVNRFEMGFRYLTTRAFLLNATFVGVLLGGMYTIDAGGKALWKMHNPGNLLKKQWNLWKKPKDLRMICDEISYAD